MPFFFGSCTPESHLLAFTKKYISDIRKKKRKEGKKPTITPRSKSFDKS